MIDPLADALLPPASLALLGFFLLLTRRRRAAAVALAALVLFSVEGVPRLLVAPLLLPAAMPPSMVPGATPSAIVVLASAIPELLDAGQDAPSLETLKRLRTAAALSRRTGAPILVSGAQDAEGAVPLARRMARSLEDDFHVHARWAESEATNLWQSAAASAAMLRPAGIADIYLVAQPWELRLSVAVFRAAGLHVTPAPVPHATPSLLDLSTLVFLASAWLDSDLALRQWAGLACQALDPCVAWMRGRDRPLTPGPS